MAKIVSIHSFRGGTGKSNTTANITTLLASEGRRVGVVDTDISSPGIHVLFGMQEEQMTPTLNDYLWGRANITETAHDMTSTLGPGISGKVYLIPSSIKVGEIARVLREGYDVGLLNEGFQQLIESFNLDVLMIDTHPGLSNETLLSIAISDTLCIILRPDQQDFQGTGVTVEVARKIGVPRLTLLVNKSPTTFDSGEVRKRVEQAYNAEVAGVLPHSDEMMTLASGGIFVLRYPNHPITQALRQVARRLTE